jgi:hypothetical protein
MRVAYQEFTVACYRLIRLQQSGRDSLSLRLFFTRSCIRRIDPGARSLSLAPATIEACPLRCASR